MFIRKFMAVLLVGLTGSLVAPLGCCKGEEAPPTTTAPAAPAAPAPAGTWTVGAKVDVEWNGSWWKGEVLEVKDGKYKVHYTGWSSSWDEWAGPERLRAPTAGSKAGTGG